MEEEVESSGEGMTQVVDPVAEAHQAHRTSWHEIPVSAVLGMREP